MNVCMYVRMHVERKQAQLEYKRIYLIFFKP